MNGIIKNRKNQVLTMACPFLHCTEGNDSDFRLKNLFKDRHFPFFSKAFFNSSIYPAEFVWQEFKKKKK